MISHGTVPKIFHFINRAGGGGGEGNNVVGKRWQFAYAFIKIIRRGNTTFRGEPGRSGGREFMRAAFVHTPPVIPFVSPCFGAPLPPESIPLIPPRPRSLSPFRGGPGSNIRPVSMLFYESRRNLVNISIRKTVNKNRPPPPLSRYSLSLS